jgi:hypothetical protein
MSQQPISRSADLLRLRNEGFNVRIVAGHLVIGDIPYVNAQRKVLRGILVSTLALNNNVAGPPDTHVTLFGGERPCRADGTPLSKVINSENAQRIGDSLTVQFSFSSKPASGRYDNYYDKITTYAAILTNEAQAIDPTVKPQTFPLVPPDDEDDVFLYEDTASSRAGITAATAKLRQRRVVIAGLGGSGSYVLDLVAKTPVMTIRLYDGDVYQQHNAFRSPGAARGEDLQRQPNKAEYWAEQYAAMRRGIVALPKHLDASNAHELAGADFVFLCMDGGEKKKPIIRKLEELGISFIDVGMGLELVDDALTGILRVTASMPERRDHVWQRQRIPFSTDGADGVYGNNIQVADLNALNAALAVIKWKKMVGFYRDEVGELYTTYTIDGHALIKEEVP